jgi:predicted MPP superfamily phosphohydrolase
LSTLRLLTFVGIISTIMLLVHRYVWARVVRDPAWPAPWAGMMTVGIFFLAALIPVAFLTMRWAPRAIGAPVSWVAYTWLGFVFYLFLLTALSDFARGAVGLLGRLPHEPERRQLLARVMATGIASLAGLLGIFGIIKVARGFNVRRVRIPLAKLSPSASGYVIVQMTDVHIGPTIGREFLEHAVRETNALAPDLVVITGDLVDGSVEQLASLVEPLRDLRAKDGVFFVTGNHEYYSGADAWIAHLSTLGVRVLRNERVDVRGLFDLAGVDDASAARMLPTHGQDVAKAATGRDPKRPLVLLAHQPKALKDALAAGVDLQLSGHVHGGQMVPFNWLARLDQPLVAGLHLVEKTWVYVSTGTGYWGPPMRVGTTAELTRIELVSEDATAAV